MCIYSPNSRSISSNSLHIVLTLLKNAHAIESAWKHVLELSDCVQLMQSRPVANPAAVHCRQTSSGQDSLLQSMRGVQTHLILLLSSAHLSISCHARASLTDDTVHRGSLEQLIYNNTPIWFIPSV